MFRNYLVIALRNIWKYKGFSFINILGLAIGLACCILILLFIQHELSFDKYHNGADRTYRVVIDIKNKTSSRQFAATSFTLAPALKENFAEVESTARVWKRDNRLVKYENKMFYEDFLLWADHELFEVLTIPFITGDNENALSRPNTVVLTQRMANKYFGSENPLGRTLNINTIDYEITGVVANAPKNTHLKYNFIVSLKTYETRRWMANWHTTMSYTYVKLKPNTDSGIFSDQVEKIADRYVGEILQEWGSEYVYSLQPIASIHLYSNIRNEAEAPSDPKYIYIFMAVAVLILLIACINFINLVTARSMNRFKEVSIRKVVGAKRGQLVRQFFGESFVLFTISLLIAFVSAELFKPIFNDLSGLDFSLTDMFKPGLILPMIGITIFMGLATGFYPAFFMTIFSPVQSLKGVFRKGYRGSNSRRILVVVQFAISIVLIIGTIIVFQQLDFMKNQELGFDQEKKLVIPVKGGLSLEENYESVKNEFLQHSSVSKATVSSSVPGRDVENYATRLTGVDDDKNQSMFHLYFDYDFIPQFDIELVAGRSFQEELATDINATFLINEAAVKSYGFNSPEEALGAKIQTGNGGHINEIIGVVKDFHYRGLQTAVEPLIMEFLPEMFGFITLTVTIDNVKETLSFAENKWRKLYPQNPFEYFFLDADFERQYQSEERLGKLFGAFTFVGIFVACLGLFALASFISEQRTKEIGIRKVLGAPVPGLVLLLTREFVTLVLLAILVAWPLAWYATSSWLDGFAYRVDLLQTGWVFALAGGVALLIALLTVSSQAIRAAVANPVDSLRYE